MIFNDITFMQNLPLEQYKNHFGNKIKQPSQNINHRSNMMLNPLNLKHLNRIDNNIADAITINLEDAIAPSRKKEALYNTAMFLSNLEKSNSDIIVRINPLELGGKDEIELLNQFSFNAFRLPKVKTAKDIEQILSLTKKDIHMSLETKEAFNNIAALKIDSRVTTANLGILDLLASMNLPQSLLTFNNPTIEYILSKFLVDCKVADILPVSFMFQDYNNIEDFTRWCKLEQQMGFVSKACLGPKQVIVANDIFGVTQDDIQRAKDIKKLFEDSSLNGINGFMSDKYGFIDEPIYRDALNILGKV